MKKSTIILVALAFVVLGVVLGLLIWPKELANNGQPMDNQPSTNQPITTNPEPTATTTEPEIITTDIDTSDWKTYRNEEYGYTIKYPQDNVDMVVGSVLEGGTRGNPGFRIKEGGHFAIGVYDNQNKLTAQGWLDQRYSDYSGGWIGEYKNEQLNRRHVTRAISDNRKDGDPYQCYIEWTILPAENRFYTIMGELCNTGGDSIDLFKKIISTFQLTK